MNATLETTGGTDALVAARRAPRRPDHPRIEIIVPVFNEEDAIEPFLDQVRPVLDGLDADWTLIFVNDGSTDATLSLVMAQVEADPRISCINLARNFGKEAALTAGLDAAHGDIAVIMDVDLQDPPELIADFLAKWREGYDVVYGVRIARGTDTWLKRITSEHFYRVFNMISPVKIPANVGDYRLMDARVLNALRALPERNRFMKGLFAWVGFPSAGIAFERPERAAGTTKFRMRRLWNFALDGLFGFSTLPLKAWTYFGVLLALIAILYAGYIFLRTLIFGIDVPGYASLTVIILVAAGAQLISLGVIGEYIARLTIEAKQRPNYLVEHHYRADETE